MRHFFVFTMIMKTRPWRHIHHDIEIPRLKSHDIEIPRPKSHDIEKRRQISHDIVIPRRFFRGQKATTSRFQDEKATKSSSCGILTLKPLISNPGSNPRSDIKILARKFKSSAESLRFAAGSWIWNIRQDVVFRHGNYKQCPRSVLLLLWKGRAFFVSLSVPLL